MQVNTQHGSAVQKMLFKRRISIQYTLKRIRNYYYYVCMYLWREGIFGVSALALLTAVGNQAIQFKQILLRHLRAIQLSLRGLWRGGSMAGNHGYASIVCTQCFTLASIARPGRELRGIGIGSNKRKMTRATSFVRSFMHSFIHSFVHFLDGENGQATTNSFIHSFIRSCHVV